MGMQIFHGVNPTLLLKVTIITRLAFFFWSKTKPNKRKEKKKEKGKEKEKEKEKEKTFVLKSLARMCIVLKVPGGPRLFKIYLGGGKSQGQNSIAKIKQKNEKKIFQPYKLRQRRFHDNEPHV